VVNQIIDPFGHLRTRITTCAAQRKVHLGISALRSAVTHARPDKADTQVNRPTKQPQAPRVGHLPPPNKPIESTPLLVACGITYGRVRLV
jgi:hypothetical protein